MECLLSGPPGVDRVIVTGDYFAPEVGELCLAGGVSLLVRLSGRQLWVGPASGDGGICWECFTFYLGLRGVWRAGPCELSEEASAALRTHAEQWRELRRSISIVDLDSGDAARVRVRSRDDCVRCRRETIALKENLQILSHPLSGILERVKVEPVPGTGLFASLGSVLMPPEVRADRGSRLFASGKGRSADRARRMLTLEAAERYSVLFDATEPMLLGTVGGTAAFLLESLLQDTRVKSLSPADEIIWAPARSLADGSTVPVPAGYVYLDYVFESEPMYHRADTNGCAAGETIEDAIQRALLEVVERDALAIWWYNRVERPELSFAPGELKARDEAAAALAARERSLHLFDLTHDLGVPVVAAISARGDGSAIYLGAAADVTIEQAARRAIEEMLQFWFWDTFQERVPDSRSAWIENATLATFPFLWSRRQQAVRSREPAPVLENLLARGFRPLWVDLTRPALGVPVVRAIVPGLRHYRRRFAPGRLFDVPVELGWQPRKLAEEELNPYEPPL